MNGETETAKAAANEMVDANRNELRRDLISDGIYHVVVEGGYHTEALSDEEADYLSRLIVTGGLEQLEQYANR